MSDRYGRRKRRQQKAALRNGPDAKPRHRLTAGRTGKVHAGKLRSRRKASR